MYFNKINLKKWVRMCLLLCFYISFSTPITQQSVHISAVFDQVLRHRDDLGGLTRVTSKDHPAAPTGTVSGREHFDQAP